MQDDDRVWSLYVLECDDGSCYTGISPDPVKRFAVHCAGKGAAYTRMHPPKTLLVTEPVGTYSQALRREWQVKRLSKVAKQKFVLDPAALAPPAVDGKICLTGKKKRLKTRKRR
ncbi:GIY-YIG nuclease family protein [Bdellovibrionota bacterium FG-1]